MSQYDEAFKHPNTGSMDFGVEEEVFRKMPCEPNLEKLTLAPIVSQKASIVSQKSIRPFPKMQTMVWPFLPAVVPDYLTGDRGYMLYPNTTLLFLLFLLLLSRGKCHNCIRLQSTY